MRIIVTMVLTMLLLTACSEDETVSPIHKVDEEQASDAVLAETDRMSSETDEKEEFIEFTVDEDVVTISIRDIPILHQYLEVQKNPQQKIREMTLNKYEVGLQAFFLLRFSCYEKQCSYLLLHPEKNKPATLIADMASLDDVSLSPDESKVAFHFKRLLADHELPVSNIIVFDLNDWTTVALENNGQVGDKLGYERRITDLEWINNESLAIQFPDLLEPDTDSLEAWRATEEIKETTIVYHLHSN